MFAGIFILNRDVTMAETIDDLALIVGASDPDEYADQPRRLPVSWRFAHPSE